MTLPTHFKLNNGLQIPVIGLGTWQAKPGEVGRAVKHALQHGYRHIDCALIYRNEAEVGEAIADSGVPRNEIFLTGKLWNVFHSNPTESLERTLKALKTDYLDLFLVHWPVRLVANDTSDLSPVNADGSKAIDRSWDQMRTWRGMEEIYASGKVKAIGVCNWSIPYLKELEKGWTVVPAVNQVELHPFLPQHELKAYCEARGILLEAYSPLGSTNSPLLSDPDIQRIAERNNVSPATLLISYQVDRGCVVLSKSVTPARIESNLKLVHLSAEDVGELDRLSENGKALRTCTPLWGWDLGFDDWYRPKTATIIAH